MDNKLNGVDFLGSLYKKGEPSFCGENKSEYYAWRDDLRQKLGNVLGLNRLSIVEPEEEILSHEDMGDYLREKIIINTLPELKMSMYRLVPKAGGNNIPVIAIHGHGSDGKNCLVGIVNKGFKVKNEKFDYGYGLQLVKEGYTVFVPDLMGSGERNFTYNNRKIDCYDYNNVLISLGLSLLGVHISEMGALIHYVLGDKALKGDKLSVIGFSGGGFLALLTSAFFDEVYFTGVSGFFHGFKNTMLTSNYCGCNFVPEMWNLADIGDIGALIAPRRLYIETGRNDSLNGVNGLDNVYPQLDIVNRAYKIFGSYEPVFKVYEGKHKWYGGCIAQLGNSVGL